MWKTCFLLHSILFFHIPAFSESILFAQNTFDLRALNDFLFTSSDTSSETQNDSKYSRSKFGHGWKDFDRDCQNSRHETLIAQSLSSVAFKTYKNCKVVSGEWNSPFSNERIFLASKIDIDQPIIMSKNEQKFYELVKFIFKARILKDIHCVH